MVDGNMRTSDLLEISVGHCPRLPERALICLSICILRQQVKYHPSTVCVRLTSASSIDLSVARREALENHIPASFVIESHIHSPRLLTGAV
jgi:hypothetical protein